MQNRSSDRCQVVESHGSSIKNRLIATTDNKLRSTKRRIRTTLHLQIPQADKGGRSMGRVITKSKLIREEAKKPVVRDRDTETTDPTELERRRE